MKNIIIIITIVLVLFLINCTTNKTAIENQQKDISTNEVLVTLRENTLAKYDSIQLINSSDEYYSITNAINEIRMPGIEFKEVNFDKNSVVLINMMAENYSDFEIYSKTEKNATTLFYSGIHYKENQIHLNNLRLIKLVEIPKTNKIVSFKPMH
ncbi:hypothetical protein [Faecalibacter bovis]|uniref:Lipoprotein n=1 Tax=Faecalibacter bovis TaxID=2898187 RepID=A0ABX7XEE9_9FLAO|nr:hypothetical protein [Faecalibacter bovis]QTV06299.1 hypothetical protein J9309_02910 [Faecalibacter bovis]